MCNKLLHYIVTNDHFSALFFCLMFSECCSDWIFTSTSTLLACMFRNFLSENGVAEVHALVTWLAPIVLFYLRIKYFLLHFHRKELIFLTIIDEGIIGRETSLKICTRNNRLKAIRFHKSPIISYWCVNIFVFGFRYMREWIHSKI